MPLISLSVRYFGEQSGAEILAGFVSHLPFQVADRRRSFPIYLANIEFARNAGVGFGA